MPTPDALIGKKVYHAEPFVDFLTQREITPIDPAQGTTGARVKLAAITILFS